MHNIRANRASIPALGFGTFRMSDQEVATVLPAALNLGFCHVDTAQIYGNEAAVGEAIKASRITRSDIFLTAKVWITNFAPDRFQTSVEESLRKLDTDYVDLLLLHWPNGSNVARDVQIEELNKAHARGLTRHIGVSNYSAALMREAVALSKAPLVNNQIEYHPWLSQAAVLAQAQALGMSVTGYFAMAEGRSVNEPLLADIGARHGKTAAQVTLRWLVQQDGIVALSKTGKCERLKENFDIFDFELSSEDMAAIYALAEPEGRIVKQPKLAPDWD